MSDIPHFDMRSPPNIEWFNRIYACIQNKDNEKNEGFDCYKFKTAEEAFTFISIERLRFNNKNVLIPMCRWTPQIFDKFLLTKKLEIYTKANN